MRAKPLARDFFQRDPRIVARELLGRMLIAKTAGQVVSGIIVETEGYLAARDSACHATRGRTMKSEVMFGEAGFSYVYSIHAKYCFNIVTQEVGLPSAVLIRAIQPTNGIRLMQRRRRQLSSVDLARGPARLCQAFAIDRSHNGLDLTIGRGIWVESAPVMTLESRDVRVTPRIGVTSAHTLKLRFVIRGNRFVSGPLRLR